jgi:hypothetical protein
MTNALILAAEAVAFLTGIATIVAGFWFLAAIYGG